MKRTFTSAFLSVVGGKFAIVFVSFLITPFLVRVLGATPYGQYATIMSVFALVMILVSSGVNAGTRKYIAEDREDDYWKSHVFGFYTRLAAILALIASGLLLGAAQAGIVDRTIGQEFAVYFYLLGMLVFASQFGEHMRRTLMGLKLEHLSEPITVMHKIVFGVSAVGLAYIGYGVAGVLAGHIIANLIKAAVSLYFINKHLSLSRVFTPSPDWFPRSDLLSFNHLSIVYVLMLTSLYHVDVLMLQMFTTSAEVGYYKIALVVVEFLWIVPRSLQAIMVQATSDLWRQGEVERITRMSSKVARYTLTFTVLLGVGLAVLAYDFVPLYAGPAYTASVVPMLLLLPGTIGFALARPILTISHAKGDLRVMIYATGLSATINIVLNLALIPQFGIEGAAIATSIGYGSLPIFHIIGARKLGYHPATDLRLGRILITGGITGAVIYPIATIIDHTLAALLIVPPIGFVVFAIVAMLIGVIAPTEVFRILQQLPAPISNRAERIERRWEELGLPLS